MSIEQPAEKSPQSAVVDLFEEAAESLGLADGLRSQLGKIESVSQQQVVLSDASTRLAPANAWTVRHSTARGPALGGIWCQPGLRLEELKAKAMLMSWRWAVLDIPLGGGKGGVDCSPAALSPQQAERLARYGLAIEPERVLGSGDGLQPAHCGTRKDAAGRGVFHVIQAACAQLNRPLDGLRVVVHGFGLAGSGAARLLAAAGARLIAASDSRGAIACESGLALEPLMAHKLHSGSVVGLHGSEPMTECEMFALDCDVLIASATEGRIRRRSAPAIRARMVVEATDGSITPLADAILESQGVVVVPDILAGAGCAAASYFESVHQPDVYARLQRTLRRSFQELSALAAQRRVNLRRAAYLLGVSRVAAASGLE